MKGIWLAVVLTLVLLVASGVWLLKNVADARAAERAMSAFTDFVRAENALHRYVLSARSGTLRNYDPIVREIAVMRDAVATLRGGDDYRVEAAVLAELTMAEEALVERFKSTNALLHNSLAYFGRLSDEIDTGQPRVARQLSGLATAVLHLTTDPSPANLERADAEIARMWPQHPEPSGPLAALLLHAQQLRRLLPEMEAMLTALADLGGGRDVEAVRASLLARQATILGRGDVVRVLLFGVALVLVGLLAWAGLQLRARINAIRRRAGIEHVVAKISMRFLKTPSWRMTENLTLALEELAVCFGATRAYFIMLGPPQLTITYARGGLPFPPNSSEEIAGRLAAAGCGDGGIVHVEDVRIGRTQAAPGYAVPDGTLSWLCIARVNGGSVQAVLGFDGDRPRAFREFDANRLLALAFDALTNAVSKTALEEERERLEAHLQHAKRIETIGVFASGIAHNFNNIIGAIAGHAEMAATEAGAHHRLAGHVHAIQVAAERARQLVDQVLGFGRRSESARRPIRVADLIAETVSLLRSSLPASVALVVREVPDALTVEAEPVQIQQIVLNLCRNAAEAVEGEGTVTLSARPAEAGAAMNGGASGLASGRYVVIAVEDDGRGMDETTLQRIFEPFFTTRRDGNGLGLATAMEVAQAHRGAITVTSEPGAGSRFEVWLPAAPADARPDEAGSPVGQARGAGETIMLVEREDEQRLRLEDVLAALGYEPVGFATFEDAAAAASAAPARFDAALVCSNRARLVGSGGPAVLHCAAPALPMVLSTSAAHNWSAEGLSRARPVEVIPYPPTSAQLAEAVASVLKGRHRPQKQ